MRYSRKLTAFIVIAATACALLGCGGGITSPDIPPHLSAVGGHSVPIDGFDEFEFPDVDGEISGEMYRERVELLYNTVVYDGKKPVLKEDDPVLPVYRAAHEFLSEYIDDCWTEHERQINIVHTIHDYLIAHTDYDFSLYQSYLSGGSDYAADPAFFIDGVLLNGKAVCDGLARTFNFLCAMEGIKSVRVTGSFASNLHAWNKVEIDGQWYNVDVTADAVHYSVGDDNYKQIAHGFMLVCDRTLKSFKPNGHDFVDTPFTADADIDSFSEDTVTIGQKSYARTVHSQAELNAIFAAVSDGKGAVGKLELKLDFAGKTQVNSADMYTTEIAEAYSKVKNPGFDLSGSTKPYFRFPNGVYLFLIYK